MVMVRRRVSIFHGSQEVHPGRNVVHSRPPAMLLLLIMKVMTSTAGVADWLAGRVM